MTESQLTLQKNEKNDCYSQKNLQMVNKYMKLANLIRYSRKLKPRPSILLPKD